MSDRDSRLERAAEAERRTGTRLADRRVVQRLLAGDEGTFLELVDRHHGTMIRVAAGYLGSTETAEEVAQETWLAVLEQLTRFQFRSSLRTWIFSILLNRIRRHRARRHREPPLSTAPPASPRSPQPEPEPVWPPSPRDRGSPEAVVLRHELLRQIELLVATLPATQQAVLRLRDIEGWSSREVCQTLEITDGHQRVLLHRARVHLRRELRGYLDEGDP